MTFSLEQALAEFFDGSGGPKDANGNLVPVYGGTYIVSGPITSGVGTGSGSGGASADGGVVDGGWETVTDENGNTICIGSDGTVLTYVPEGYYNGQIFYGSDHWVDSAGNTWIQDEDGNFSQYEWDGANSPQSSFTYWQELDPIINNVSTDYLPYEIYMSGFMYYRPYEFFYNDGEHLSRVIKYFQNSALTRPPADWVSPDDGAGPEGGNTVEKGLLIFSPTANKTVIMTATYGSKFDDVLSAGGLLAGGDGNDHLTAGSGADILSGDAGNDWVAGLGGDDLIDGGDGNDIVGGQDGNDILSGGAGDDEVWGGSGDDVAYGGAGNDAIRGEDGNDKLYGDAGNDWIAGQAGNDVVDGGDGNDVVGGQEGNDTLSGGYGNDELWGGSGADVAHGGAGNDAIRGEDGNDKLYGDAGNDWIAGLGGNDVVQGGDGDDIVGGQEGNDTLSGGYGNDELWGGSGADVFLFDTAVGAGADRIMDFSAAEGDMILLDHNVFSALGIGVLSMSAFKAGAATSTSHKILYNQATGDLSYDYDGSGSAAAVKIATLNPGTTLSASNFFVV